MRRARDGRRAVTQIDGPRLHRLARRYTGTGFRGSGTLWKYVERVRPLPASSTLRTGEYQIQLHLASDIVDVPLYRGEYEAAEQTIARRRLHPGAVFVDVGANRGLYTALALAAGAVVTAIEPHPTLAGELRGQFPDARVEQVAVADVDGTATLHVFPNTTYMSSIRATDVGGTHSIDVPVVRLDELLGDIAVIDLIKIDVEHLEAAVLTGASGLFERGAIRAALVEVFVDHERIAEMLSGWGYRSRLIARAGRVRRRPILGDGVDSGIGGNYLVERDR